MQHKYIVGYVVVFIFTLFTRFWMLDRLPVSLVHDETVHAAHAKSFAVQGKTLDQAVSWWSLQPVHPFYAELPSVVMAPAFWFTDSPLLASHGASAFMGVLLPLILAWFAYGIWRSPRLSVLTAFVAATNPLLWQFSRLSYDATFSIFFYMLGAAILVNTKQWWRLLSIPALGIGFFQYQGLKLVLVPFVFGIIGLYFLQRNLPSKSPRLKTAMDFVKSWEAFIQKSTNKEMIGVWLVAAFSLALTLFYGFYILPNQDLSNRTDYLIFKSDTLSDSVNLQRRLSIDSPTTNIASNKLWSIFDFMLTRGSHAFNPEILFVRGEIPISLFAVTTHGLFYLIDILLIGIAFYVFSQSYRRKWQLVVFIGLVIALGLPTYINTQSEWHLLRTQLAYTMLIFPISWGLWWVSQRRWIFVPVMMIYLLSVLNFSYHYFFRYPLTSADRANIAERVISRYIAATLDTNPNQEIVIYSHAPEMLFFNYLVFTNQINTQTVNEIAKQLNQDNENQHVKRLTLHNVIFTNECVPAIYQEGTVHITDQHFPTCIEELPEDLLDKKTTSEENKTALPQQISVPSVLDSGERYRITGDTLCDMSTMTPFVQIKNFNQFDIEKMSGEELCHHWLSDLSQVK